MAPDSLVLKFYFLLILEVIGQSVSKPVFQPMVGFMAQLHNQFRKFHSSTAAYFCSCWLWTKIWYGWPEQGPKTMCILKTTFKLVNFSPKHFNFLPSDFSQPFLEVRLFLFKYAKLCLILLKSYQNQSKKSVLKIAHFKCSNMATLKKIALIQGIYDVEVQTEFSLNQFISTMMMIKSKHLSIHF